MATIRTTSPYAADTRHPATAVGALADSGRTAFQDRPGAFAHWDSRTMPRYHLAGVNLQGANFTRAWVPGWDFGHAHMPRARFVRANLRGANFVGATVRGANFFGADLRGADLRFADMIRCDFRGAKLDGVEQLYTARVYDSIGLPDGWAEEIAALDRRRVRRFPTAWGHNPYRGGRGVRHTSVAAHYLEVVR